MLFDEYCNSIPSQFSKNMQFVILLLSHFELILPMSAIPSSLQPQNLQFLIIPSELQVAIPTGVS